MIRPELSPSESCSCGRTVPAAKTGGEQAADRKVQILLPHSNRFSLTVFSPSRLRSVRSLSPRSRRVWWAEVWLGADRREAARKFKHTVREWVIYSVTHKNPVRLISALYLFSMGGDILCLDAFPPASVFLPHSTVGTAKTGPVVPSLKLYCHSNITMCGNPNRDKGMLIWFFWEKQCFAPSMNPCKWCSIIYSYVWGEKRNTLVCLWILPHTKLKFLIKPKDLRVKHKTLWINSQWWHI